jgi:hypothetical protein
MSTGGALHRPIEEERREDTGVEAEGRVAKQVDGRGWYASVQLSLVPGSEREIALAPSAEDEWQRFTAWLDAAAAGATLGLDLAGAGGQCSITRVHGMVCDTSPGVVAIAAIRAVWTVLGFVPSRSLSAAVESCITRGHQMSVEALGAELTAVVGRAQPYAANGMKRDEDNSKQT